MTSGRTALLCALPFVVVALVLMLTAGAAQQAQAGTTTYVAGNTTFNEHAVPPWARH